MKKLCLFVLLLCMIIPVACTNEEPKSETHVADGMSMTDKDNKEFIIMRVNDDYLEISNEYKRVYLEEGGAYPELADGQIARVKADVVIYGGGHAGYMGNSFIKEIKECEILNYKEVTEELGIPDCLDEGTSFGLKYRMLKYCVSDRTYLVIANRDYSKGYLDGTCLIEYKDAEFDCTTRLNPFWEAVEQKEEEYR